MTARTGFLGLGSNVGERRSHLQGAVDELPAHGVEVVASSSVYETEPVGEVPDQRDFLNACLRIATRHSAEGLLDACKEVERVLGRRPGIRHGPRSIDVDLLLLGNERLVTPRLALPHRDIVTRRFVLVPLLELDPGLVIPGAGPAAAALAALGPGQEVRRAGEPLAPPGRD